MKRWTYWILVTATGIGLVHLALAFIFKERFSTVMTSSLWKGTAHDAHGMEVRGLLVIIMAILPAVAGAITAYSLKMAVNEQEKQYHRMKNLFKRGSECLKFALDRKNESLAVKTILDLGKEALQENGDWVVLHRERSVEMHLGG